MTDGGARHLIITGGTGYIGRRVVELALARGQLVTLLGKRPGPTGTRHVHWKLGEPLPKGAIDPAMPAEAQGLIHLAHDWASEETLNVGGTLALFDSARDAGIERRVFISSQSAREGALNRYGQIKWTIEQQLGRAASLRVGLVYGGPIMAMYGLLCRITRLPVLPMVDPHRCVQPIHRDEVAQGILAAADRALTGVLALTGPQPVPFGEVLRTMSRVYSGQKMTILPVPLKLALFGCDVTARLPLFPTVDRERVLGLAGTEPIEAAADLAKLGVTVLPFEQGLAREPSGRRALIAEGRAFLRYCLNVEPETTLVRRYARACPDGAIARPRLLLGWREPLGSETRLARRLRIAARIAETSARGEASLAQGSRPGRLAGLAAALALDAVKLPFRLIFRPREA